MCVFVNDNCILHVIVDEVSVSYGLKTVTSVLMKMCYIVKSFVFSVYASVMMVMWPMATSRPHHMVHWSLA